MATWTPIVNLGTGGTYKEIIEKANSLIEANKTLATTGKTLYEANKAFVLATVDPAFAALNVALTEVLNIITDLRSIGLYQLVIEPTSEKDESKTSTIGTLFAGGEYQAPAYILPQTNEIYPLGVIPDEYPDLDPEIYHTQSVNDEGELVTITMPVFDGNSSDKGSIFNVSTGLYEMTPSTVLNIIEKSFEDLGDVNRPILSESAASGAIIIMFTAPSLDKFIELIASLAALLNTTTFINLTNKLNKILQPPKIKLNLVDVSTIDTTDPAQLKPIYFEVDDVIIGSNSGKIGTVTNVVTEIPEQYKGKTNTFKVAKQTLTVTQESQFNQFSVGELVTVAVERSIEVKDADGNVIDDPEGKIAQDKKTYGETKAGIVKKGLVVDSLEDDVKSIKPDFTRTTSMADIFPIIDDGLSAVESFVRGLQGTIKGYDSAFDEIVKYIDSKIEELENLSAKLNNLLKLFATELPDVGLYITTIESPTGGVQGFMDQLRSAENLPASTNKYSAALMLFGSGTSIESVTKIGNLIGN